MRIEFTPSDVRRTQISDQIWKELFVDNNQIDKLMLIEGLRYYRVVLVWIRLASLKHSNNYTLTDNETRLVSVFEM